MKYWHLHNAAITALNYCRTLPLALNTGTITAVYSLSASEFVGRGDRTFLLSGRSCAIFTRADNTTQY